MTGKQTIILDIKPYGHFLVDISYEGKALSKQGLQKIDETNELPVMVLCRVPCLKILIVASADAVTTISSLDRYKTSQTLALCPVIV